MRASGSNPSSDISNKTKNKIFYTICSHQSSSKTRLLCVYVLYLFHTHTNVVVGLLITSSMYVLNDVTLLSFT